MIGSPQYREGSMRTVVCRTDCSLYEMTEKKAKQLYFLDRLFGFAVLKFIIAAGLKITSG